MASLFSFDYSPAALLLPVAHLYKKRVPVHLGRRRHPNNSQRSRVIRVPFVSAEATYDVAATIVR